MKAKIWLISWFVMVTTILCILGFWVYKIDPYFHYHKPALDKYYYTLDNQRSQNDGIIKHFDYDALISGTSMTENFKTTETDKLFGCNSIKVSFSGGSYKEINDNIKNALEVNPDLKIIIRGLDMGRFFDEPDLMRMELGKYPTYLYDKNPLNDIEYLLNRDTVFGRAYPMTVDSTHTGFTPGITSFDDYSRWQDEYKFGINTVSPYGLSTREPESLVHLTDAEKEIIKQNINLNVTNIAVENPDIDFYYFYTPYSIVWWNNIRIQGNLYKQLEAERYITELIIQHDNIHLFSFNNRYDLITDLNNYKDDTHYAAWINSLILKWMHDGSYQITKDNYEDYLQKEYVFYTTFDYASVNGQLDYEADYYAAALLNTELTGACPIDILNNERINIELGQAEYLIDGDNNIGINCFGNSKNESGKNLEAYGNEAYSGAKFSINLDAGYNYLSFYGLNISNQASPIVYVYDENGEIISRTEINSANLNNQMHQYVIDLSSVSGNITVVFNNEYLSNTENVSSEYQFHNIYLY